MRFLKRAITAHEPLLIKASDAIAAVESAAQVGITDQLAFFFGDRPKAYRVGKVGVVPLAGVIGTDLAAIDKAQGGVDLKDFRAELAKMAARPDVEVILVHVNSPGGAATGTLEAANDLYNLSKPTVTFVDGVMGSGGYFVGSQSDRVIATPSSIVGSIGAYTVYYEYDLAREGYTAKMFKDGTLKADGAFGVPLTAEQEAHIQAQIAYIGGVFRDTVLRKRSMVSMADMQGQTFRGAQAAEKGLVTGLVNSLDELIAELNS